MIGYLQTEKAEIYPQHFKKYLLEGGLLKDIREDNIKNFCYQMEYCKTKCLNYMKGWYDEEKIKSWQDILSCVKFEDYNTDYSNAEMKYIFSPIMKTLIDYKKINIMEFKPKEGCSLLAYFSRAGNVNLVEETTKNEKYMKTLEDYDFSFKYALCYGRYEVIDFFLRSKDTINMKGIRRDFCMNALSNFSSILDKAYNDKNADMLSYILSLPGYFKDNREVEINEEKMKIRKFMKTCFEEGLLRITESLRDFIVKGEGNNTSIFDFNELKNKQKKVLKI